MQRSYDVSCMPYYLRLHVSVWYFTKNACDFNGFFENQNKLSQTPLNLFNANVIMSLHEKFEKIMFAIRKQKLVILLISHVLTVYCVSNKMQQSNKSKYCTNYAILNDFRSDIISQSIRDLS